jgi:hypothetical protein
MGGYVWGVAAMYVKHVRCVDPMALLPQGSDLRYHTTRVMGNCSTAPGRPAWADCSSPSVAAEPRGAGR